MSQRIDLPKLRVFWGVNRGWAIVTHLEDDYLPRRTVIRMGPLRICWRHG